MKIGKKITKVSSVLYVVLFLLAVLVPLVTINTEKDVTSEIDNRNLTELAEVGTVGFTSNFESYLSDRVGYRNQMINAYAVLNDVVADELTHSLYTYGQNGYIFFNMHNNITFSDFHQAFVDMVVKLNEYCQERGTKFYFLFDPEKSSVYRRYLPEGVNYDDSWVDTLIEKLEEQGVVCVNNTELLTEKSMEESVFNVEYDAGHWNDLGCFYATNGLFARIQEDFPAVQPLTLDMFNVNTVTPTTLPVSEFQIEEDVPNFTLNSAFSNITSAYDNEVERDETYSVFRYFVNEAEGAEELPKTLVFQGSYYNRNFNFLIRGTSEYIAVHNYQNILNFDYYYNMFQPEMVIFDVAEYTFYDQYFSYNGMLTLDLNPGIVNRQEDAETQIAQLLDQAEELTTDAELVAQIGDQLDQVIVESYYQTEGYAYLIIDDQVFDLARDNQGVLSATIPSGLLEDDETAIIYLMDSNGEGSYFTLPVQTMCNLLDKLSVSSGVTKQTGDSYLLTTDVDGNEFIGIILQVLTTGGENQTQALSVAYAEGDYAGAYTHTMDSGWYTIRLKANSNLADEGLYQMVYLVNGYTYSYAYTVDQLEAQQAEVENIQFIGPNEEPDSLLDALECSDGVVEKQNHNYHLTTDVAGNEFSQVTLQLYEADATDACAVLTTADSAGIFQGTYTHTSDSGWYTLELRANANLSDESIWQQVYLQQGVTYRYVFRVKTFEAQEVHIKNFLFQPNIYE